MAGMGRQVTGDGLPINLAGMSKSQLYDIMSQMKSLIEQNQQQARQILIQNPLLTKALFQAQIMLGMVQPPQATQSIQPPPTHHTQQSNTQAAPIVSGQVGTKDQIGGASQLQNPRMQHPNQPPTVASAAIPGLSTQPQPMPLHPLQAPQPPKGHLNAQVTPGSISQSSQIPNAQTLAHHSTSQSLPLHQPQVPTPSGQLQQPLQTAGIPHMPLQPQLPPQPRPFPHQYPPSQMGHGISFQHSGAAQHLSQPTYHTGSKPTHVGPSFPHAQAPLPSQPPQQPAYQPGGMPLATDFNSQVGSSMQVDRGSSWMSVPPENPTHKHHSAPPTLIPSQMGPSNQPARPQSLTPEMEKALLQQVMSLTPDQINLLPPEQRNQVLQLQQILRQ